ncbi:MAG: DUF559 domain-containing protein [Actinomycetota bacterium]|nr:DUF559 domain-containing protein [Actinomycetota bacterium]
MSVGNRDRARRERILRRLAARQHGLIHRDQALRVGLSPSAIDRRVRSGAWLRHYRSVYGIAGAPATFEQRGLAACLASGTGAALSHTSAGFLWGLCPKGRVLHVKVPRSVDKEPPGVRVHRTTTAPGSTGKLRCVPVTDPITTILDLAGTLSETELGAALQQAVVAGCLRPEVLRARLTTARGRPGVGTLRRVLGGREGRPRVETPLEGAVAAALADAELPPAVREHPVYAGGRVYYLDFAWPAHQVAVEADGRRWHSDSRSFEHDRVRQNLLVAAGWHVLRVTHEQVRASPQQLCAQVGALLTKG